MWELLLEECPGWGYPVLLVAAFSVCFVATGVSLRMLGNAVKLASQRRLAHKQR